MRYSKKLLSVIAMALCLSFCMGGISHAKTLQYKETNYGYISSKWFREYTCSFRIDGSGRLACNTRFGGNKYSFIKYNSKGKKTVRTLKFPGDEYGEHEGMMVYGNRAYWLDEEDYDIYVYAIKGNTIKKKPLKKIDVYYKTEKYLKNQAYYPYFELIGVGKNKVRILCNGRNEKTLIDQCAVVDVNTVTGKTKKIAYSSKFSASSYDEENVYKVIPDKPEIGKTTYYRLSLKTKKTEKITLDEIVVPGYEESEYHSGSRYGIYKGKIMAVSYSGEVYYGTFKSKKLKKIGTLNNCKKFKKYFPLNIEIKSSNEFYIVYGTDEKRTDDFLDLEEGPPYGKIFVCKYTCK